VLMFVGKCTNCGIASTGDLYAYATTTDSVSRPTCFKIGDVLCRACRSIKPENIGRYALGGLVQEAVWTGESTDVDVDNFIRHRPDDIASTFNAAIT